MEIPFVNLQAEYIDMEQEIDKAIAEVCASGRYIMGAKVEELEAKIAEYCGVKHAVACASGSDALVLSLMACGIGFGDEVITTPFTFIATAEAISRVGAKPVFVDIDPVTFNIDHTKIEAAITNRTKAIIPVHLYGLCCNMYEIDKKAREHRLIVIEDAAQAFGSALKIYDTWHPAGSMGDFGCFSFFPTKNLGCYGDGGMVVTRCDGFVDKLRRLRVHGAEGKYHHVELGINSRLDEVQAAILLVKLKSVNKAICLRIRRALHYESLFLTIPEISTPLPLDDRQSHSYNYYTIRCYKRDELKEYLSQQGISTAIYYPKSLHLQPCFEHLGHKEGDFPHSEQASKEVLSLPIQGVTDGQVEYIAGHIRKFYEG